MTSKTTTKATSPRTSRKKSQKKANRINRQRRLQKQLQILLLERHSRRCIICHHPEREAIEEEFVHWRAPWKLSQDYKLADYRTVYRHARAAGLLLQRRERLHSALDAFVESVDDVTFTGDTILRAMRAYSCIDSHGRWTEIPTQVQFSTSTDPHPTQSPAPYPRSGTDSDILDIAPKYSHHASRSDATACAASPAQALNVTEDEYGEPEDDNSDEELEEDEENAPEERVTALDVLNIIRKYANQASQSDATASSVPPKIKSRSDATFCAASPAQAPARGSSVASAPLDITPKYSNHASRSDATACAASSAQALNAPEDDSDADEESEEDAENELEEALASLSTSSKSPSRGDATFCAASPAQALNVTEDEYDEPDDDLGDEPEIDPDDDPDDNNDPKNKSEAESLEESTACAAPPAQSVEPLSSNRHGRNVTATAASASSKTRSRSDATACADSPAQALPRAVVRGQNPNDRSLFNRTDCAALPAQPAAPQKPKPDADGFIWHPRPGYPDQEISEPDAQGRVAYKIHMTTAASQLPSRETDARRAAELIYRSVIKKYGNP